VHPARLRELRDLAGFFLRLGCTAFGGPAAHVALMEREAVVRRRWLTREAFLDQLGATNLIPGPSSTQMAMGIGWRRAGWPGLLVGGCCFILPAALLTLALAWAYVRFGRLPQAQGVLYGLKPVVLAVVVQALWNLGRTAFRTPTLLTFGLLALVAGTAGLHPLSVLLGTGVLAVGLALARRPGTAAGAALPLALGGALGPAAAPAVGLASLFLLFLKLGAVLFGSGYVLLAFLQADLVDRLHWLTQGQLLDAVAAGQITPGPLFTTATFIGYLLKGIPGAVLATLGIFLPSFLMVAGLGQVVPRLRRSPAAARFLDGVNAAALALMAVVTWTLGRAALVDLWTGLLGLGSVALLVRYRLNATWLVLGGGLAGVALAAAGLVH
jgi:chromate transporter